MAIQAAIGYPEVDFARDGGFAGENGSPRSPFLDNFRVADYPRTSLDSDTQCGVFGVPDHQIKLHYNESASERIDQCPNRCTTQPITAPPIAPKIRIGA
jgi:hypothetical protein